MDVRTLAMRFLPIWFVTLALAPGMLRADPRDVRVPLTDGRLSLGQLSESIGLPIGKYGFGDRASVDVRGVGRWLVVQGLNKALGDGCRVAVADDAITIHYDPARLPHDVGQVKDAAQTFTAAVTPDASAAQARMMGLLLPVHVDPAKPMAVLVHGLDCNRENWAAMAALLEAEGVQPVYFTYPSDQPIERSAAMLARHMVAVRELYPSTPVHVIAHSMGALVARAYVEGDVYAGGIGRLILIAPPNHGSKWARWRLLLEAREHYTLWRTHDDYSPSWLITDGLGQAGPDLMPGSDFLAALNARPRRAGVRYTIIMGDRHEGYRMAGNAIGSLSALIPDRAEQWWGFRHVGGAIENLARRTCNHTDGTDGPVSLESSRLDGVDDYVLLHADHTSLYVPVGGATEPAAWEAIRERLADRGSRR